LFPPAEAALIAHVVARDLLYYDPTISEAAVAGLNRFALASGLVTGGASRLGFAKAERLVASMAS
jgi:hypothetical protein